MNEDRLRIIENLAKGYSNVSKKANQFCLTMLIVATSTILTSHIESNESKTIDLPFGLGMADMANYNAICLLLICILFIMYASSMLQTIRIRRLIQKEIDTIPTEERFVSNIHIQDYVDSILSPTYIKIAPIPQYLQGEKQFFNKSLTIKSKNNIFDYLPAFCSKWYYVILKIASFVLLYSIPGYSLFISCTILINKPATIAIFPIPVYWAFVIISFSAILILFYADIMYLVRVMFRISNKQKTN